MAEVMSARGRRVLTGLIWPVFLVAVLLSPLAWMSKAQEPPLDPALRLKIEPALLKRLAEEGAGRTPIVVEMKAAASLKAASVEPGRAKRRQAVVAALQTTAQQSQAGALTLLAGREAAGAAVNARSFWIFNGLAAEADLDTVRSLAALPEVQRVRLDREFHIENPSLSLPGAFPDGLDVESNIAQIRADLVQSALKLDGSGVVVANIDTGVDLQHPALLSRYRGYDPHGLYDHTCNWFDATGEGAVYPVDGNGHGTHTMGTMLGGEGIGVAPGANWVAVRAFDSDGYSLESWLHSAMEWVVNPGSGCTPPDVVNNSWGSSVGGNDVFRSDVQNMRAAGLFVSFSAGNDGPYDSSIGSPGSYPESFSVGAVTSGDEVARFSSRGPSTWYGKSLVKPEVSAPGVNVRSSLPGGTYGEKDGTSMAAPHAAGLAALMLQASPTLTVGQIETVMEETAVRLDSPIPNNSYGWGRIDAYAAVSTVANAGTVTGTVSSSAGSGPIADATVEATPSTSGSSAATGTDSNGVYTLALAADRYTLNASAFGYADQSLPAVIVVTNTSVVANFTLTPLPTGTLRGQVTGEGQPISPTATVAVVGTPVTVTTDASGFYTASLPGGSYTLTVTSPGHRVVVAAAVTVVAGETTVRDFDLSAAPTILLVDSGAWYYDSEIDYYRQALDELHYTYDLWPVKDPDSDVPTASVLSPYDLVFWSSPEDSPGYIGASQALTTYLSGGGALFLSGQNVAFYDGYYMSSSYFKNYLKASYAGDNAGTFDLSGDTGGPFEGLSFSIDGSGGADNQTSPDKAGVADSDYASSLVSYSTGDSGGLWVGGCLPYRAIYLSFGFGAITDETVRTEVISRSIAWLESPLSSSGVELIPADDSLVGNFGSTVTHTLRIRNTAETGPAQAFDLAIGGFSWPTSITTDSLTLASCASTYLSLTVQVPSAAAWAAADTVTVTALSATSAATATRQTRSPAPVLLVDDDRFYDVEDHYREALSANGVPYDYWEVPWSFIGSVPPSPPTATLQMYPMVLWFSAYDWYQPLTTAEEGRLAAYLEGGGRLYYNGQDYLAYSSGPNSFARNYLGVSGYTEDFSSTVASGVASNPVGAYLGPYDLSYSYKNYSDALTPTTGAGIAFVQQDGRPDSLTNSGSNWRTAFFAFDPDGLEDAPMSRLVQRLTGWLSWLGGSTVQADRTLARDGDAITYTVNLRNDGWQDVSSAYFTATLGSDLSPVASSATGGAAWDAGQSAFVWSGTLAQGESCAFTYRADVVDPPGQVVSSTVWMGYGEHYIKFDRVAITLVNVPDLSQSAFTVTPGAGAVGDVLTYTLTVSNSGTVEGTTTAVNRLPDGLALADGLIHTSDGSSQTDGRVITWTVTTPAEGFDTMTYTAIITEIPSGFLLYNLAVLSDGLDGSLSLDAVAVVKGQSCYLPVIFK